MKGRGVMDARSKKLKEESDKIVKDTQKALKDFDSLRNNGSSTIKKK